MGDGSGIEWTDATWNPILGCSRVSPGCDHCYAERQTATRMSKVPAYAGLTRDGKWTGEMRWLSDRLDQPLRWKRPRRVFVNSMSDLFHPDVPVDVIARVWAVMDSAEQHQFQILTKRPQRMAQVLTSNEFVKAFLGRRTWTWRDLVPPFALHNLPLANVWLGTSIESQGYAFRARHLLDTPAAVHFVSAEPLLGPLDLTEYLEPLEDPTACGDPEHCSPYSRTECIDWVIVGGESGPGARPMHPDWARSLRRQCQAAGVPFLFKQHGEWRPLGDMPMIEAEKFGLRNLRVLHRDGTMEPNLGGEYLDDDEVVARLGKHRAGRELDGRLWDEYPA